MAQYHFVEDYENLVRSLIQAFPIDVAMEKASGGDLRIFGEIEADILLHVGLREGMRLIDLGCGCGRLAAALHGRMRLSYLGIDIVQELLDYAKSKAPAFSFRLHRQLSIAEAGGSADMLCAFSLFTHLLHAETYVYLEEAFRVLRPGGKVVFSFLEFAEPHHWNTFAMTKAETLSRTSPHLNMFIERGAIDVWCRHLGFTSPHYIDATAQWQGHALGQTVAVLLKPAA